MRNLFFIVILAISFVSCGHESKIEWKKMSSEIFDQAKSEHKIVLLNLEANWCHWCHVMEDSTYSDPEVIDYINAHFIPVKADQDANPELSIRYKEFGWPATIFINEQGEDVVKRAGYISPKYFLKLLKAIVKDPSLEEPIADLESGNYSSSEIEIQLNRIEKNVQNSVDLVRGGFDQPQKYVEYATFEYALFQSDNQALKNWTKTSMNGAKNLSDPVWGGIYQYSTHNDWNHLHFEKLLSIQARYLKLFSYNYHYNNDGESLNKVKSILQYIDRFLKHDNGLYSNAQDADLVQGEHAEDYFKLNNEERLKRGIPKIDTNTFTNNNAEIASSLLLVGDLLNDKSLQEKAIRIEQLLSLRQAKNGLFYHDFKRREVFSLKDQIAMAYLYIDLVKSNISSSVYEKKLRELVIAINANFSLDNGSAKSFVGSNGLKPAPIIIENINLGRINSWLYHYTKDKQYDDMANELFMYCMNPSVIEDYYALPELLMFAKELKQESNEYVFVDHGGKTNFLSLARALAPFNSSIKRYAANELPKDKRELFGDFKEDVLFICNSTYCSSPIRSKDEVLNYYSK